MSKNRIETVDLDISGCEGLEDLLLSSNMLQQLPDSIGEKSFCFYTWLRSQKRVKESSPNRNPHRSGFFDRVVVNKTATPGTIDIAAKTVRHHPLPFPQHPVTNLFFPVCLDIPGITIGTVPVHEEWGGIQQVVRDRKQRRKRCAGLLLLMAPSSKC